MTELITYLVLSGIFLLTLGVSTPFYVLWMTDRIDFKKPQTLYFVYCGFVGGAMFSIIFISQVCAKIGAMN